MKYLTILLLFAVMPVPHYAFAQTCPENSIWNDATDRCITCWEIGTCPFTTDPLGTMLLPFESIFGGLTIIVLWGLLISIIWLRTQNPMLVGLVGIAMTAGYLSVTPEAPPNELNGARIIGGALFALSLGITLYHLVSSRIYQGPT